MTELINQLVEKIEKIEFEPKYVVVKRFTIEEEVHAEKWFSGNDKEELKNRLLELAIKGLSLGEYLKAEQLEKAMHICPISDDSDNLSIVYHDKHMGKKTIIVPNVVGVRCHYTIEIEENKVNIISCVKGKESFLIIGANWIN